jgi:hypothetical protein
VLDCYSTTTDSKESLTVRWESLFADLEAQAAFEARAEAFAEISERTRIESSKIRLADRLGSSEGSEVRVRCLGGCAVSGLLRRAGEGWLLLAEPAGREAIIAVSALVAVTGSHRLSSAPGTSGQVTARLGLSHVLRAVARDRSPARVELVDGSAIDGTIDRVGADFIEVAAHAPGEYRRRAEVRAVMLAAMSQIAVIRRDAD